MSVARSICVAGTALCICERVRSDKKGMGQQTPKPNLAELSQGLVPSLGAAWSRAALVVVAQSIFENTQCPSAFVGPVLEQLISSLKLSSASFAYVPPAALDVCL